MSTSAFKTYGILSFKIMTVSCLFACCCVHIDSWVHCNDAKMQLVSLDDVMKCQAYILFYTRKHPPSPYSADSGLSSASMTETAELFTEKADDEVTFNFENSSIPRFLELKRKLSLDHEGRMALKRRRSNQW